MEGIQSAGVIVVRFENNKPYFLLLRAYNFWDFPKGKIENDETKLQAALREVNEESGICDLKFNWGRAYYETERFGRNNKVVYYFVASTENKSVCIENNPITGCAEHQEYRWVSYDEAMILTKHRIQKAIGWAVNRIKVFENGSLELSDETNGLNK